MRSGWASFLQWLQGATSQVTRLINSADANDYIEGTVDNEFSLFLNTLRQLQLSIVVTALRMNGGITAPLTSFEIGQNTAVNSNRIFLTGNTTRFEATEVSPQADDVTTNGRTRRWQNFRMARPEEIEDWLSGSVVADFPRYTFGGTAAPTIVTNGLRGILAIANTAAVASTSTYITDSLNFTRAILASSEHIIRGVAAADLVDVIVRFGLTSDISFGGATDALVVEFDDVANANFRLVGYSAGVRTVAASATAPVAGTFVRAEVLLAADGSGTLFLNGTSAATVAAASAGATAMGVGGFVTNQGAAGVNTWQEDRHEVRATAVV